jgi:cell division ATPase MinD
MAKFIAIASAKGGVGKTTVAVNLSTAMASFGRNVLLVDANLKTPNVSIHLGAPNVKHTIHSVITGDSELKEAVYIHPSGLKVVPADISLESAKKADYKRLKDVIPKLGEFADIVIMDSAGGISRPAFSSLELADEVLLVTTPQLAPVTDALKAVHLSEEKGINVIGVVLNDVAGSSEIDTRNVEIMLDKPVISVIPRDDAVRESLMLRHPVVYAYPDSKPSVAYKKLAALLIGQKYDSNLQSKETGFDHFLKKQGFLD